MTAITDPVERIRHDITHAPAPKRGTFGYLHLSDFECGMRLLWAAFDWRMDKLIAEAGEREMRAHWRRVETANRSLGQRFRRAAT